jgi:uncharacterized membrane protein YtjA (UPF0391 family)
MLRWAGVFLVLLIVMAVLGFVLDLAGGLFKLLFFACLIGFAVTAVGRWFKRRT